MCIGVVLSLGRLSDVAVSLAIAFGCLVLGGLVCWSAQCYPADSDNLDVVVIDFAANQRLVWLKLECFDATNSPIIIIIFSVYFSNV